MVAFTKFITAIAAAFVTVSAIPLEAENGLEIRDGDIEVISDAAAAAARSGDLTYYSPGLGACGRTNGPNDPVVALSHGLFDPQTPNGNPNNNPLCGRRIRITRNGKSVTVTVRDRCAGCQTNDLDVSPSAFQKVATLSEGRVRVQWEWV